MDEAASFEKVSRRNILSTCEDDPHYKVFRTPNRRCSAPSSCGPTNKRLQNIPRFEALHIKQNADLEHGGGVEHRCTHNTFCGTRFRVVECLVPFKARSRVGTVGEA